MENGVNIIGIIGKRSELRRGCKDGGGGAQRDWVSLVIEKKRWIITLLNYPASFSRGRLVGYRCGCLAISPRKDFALQGLQGMGWFTSNALN